MPSLNREFAHPFAGIDLGKFPKMKTSHDQFAERGSPWATPYEEDAPPKPQTVRGSSHVLAGYFTEEDTTRMLSADMAQRRHVFNNLRAVLATGSNIKRID